MNYLSNSTLDKKDRSFPVLLMVIFMFFILVMAVIVAVLAFVAKSFSGDTQETRRREKELEIVFHPHAIARMRERGIEPGRIEMLLGGDGSTVKFAGHNRLRISDGVLTAIIDKGLGTIEVVTVFWNGKAEDNDTDELEF